MKIKKFNQKGHQEFKDVYDQIFKSVSKKGWEKGYDNTKRKKINDILEDDSYHEALIKDIELKQKNFNTSYEFGTYLEDKFKDLDNIDIIQDKLLWDWISLFYFDMLIPKSGTHASRHRYFLSDEWHHRNRHLARTPWYLKITYGKFSKLLSSLPTNQGGHWREEFISHRDNEKFIITCEIAYKLYFDEERQRPLEGYSKRWVKRKGIRTEVDASLGRLIMQLKQYSQVYNINSMSANDFIALLGKEFDKLKKESN